jgi:hypothetical protein
MSKLVKIYNNGSLIGTTTTDEAGNYSLEYISLPLNSNQAISVSAVYRNVESPQGPDFNFKTALTSTEYKWFNITSNGGEKTLQYEKAVGGTLPSGVVVYSDTSNENVSGFDGITGSFSELLDLSQHDWFEFKYTTNTDGHGQGYLLEENEPDVISLGNKFNFRASGVNIYQNGPSGGARTNTSQTVATTMLSDTGTGGYIHAIRIERSSRNSQSFCVMYMHYGRESAPRATPICQWSTMGMINESKKFRFGLYNAIGAVYTTNISINFGSFSDAPRWTNPDAFSSGYIEDRGDLQLGNGTSIDPVTKIVSIGNVYDSVNALNSSGLRVNGLGAAGPFRSMMTTTRGDITVSLWVKFTTQAAIHPTYPCIPLFVDHYSGVSQGNFLAYRIISGFTGFEWFPSGTGYRIAYSGLNDGNWHHVVATYNNTSINLYVDGVAIGTGTYTKTSYHGSSGLEFGNSTYGTAANYPGSRYLNGEMRKIKIFPGRASHSDIWELYQLDLLP